MQDPLTPLADGMIPAAMRDAASRGREYPEPEHPYRGRYQRDRDRIIHSTHFRRLEYKTQVFVNGEGDNYRTRLTHTLEVTQIARSISRALHLNEDLAEAVALSHDLGHTPFGHAGERVLNSHMADVGGFNHNAQGLRIVDMLESRYEAFPGLNLSYEVREAFVRHGGAKVALLYPEFRAGDAPLLEVESTIIADDIAYLAHDIDDGLYSGILVPEQLAELDLWREATADENFADLPQNLKRTVGVRKLINLLVTDVLETSKNNLVRKNIIGQADVREQGESVVSFSIKVEEKKNALKEFLFRNFYRHPNVMAELSISQTMLSRLFSHYSRNVEKMPLEYQKIADISGNKRAAADYVSGMTDRFAREDFARFLDE